MQPLHLKLPNNKTLTITRDAQILPRSFTASSEFGGASGRIYLAVYQSYGVCMIECVVLGTNWPFLSKDGNQLSLGRPFFERNYLTFDVCRFHFVPCRLLTYLDCSTPSHGSDLQTLSTRMLFLTTLVRFEMNDADGGTERDITVVIRYTLRCRQRPQWNWCFDISVYLYISYESRLATLTFLAVGCLAVDISPMRQSGQRPWSVKLNSFIPSTTTQASHRMSQHLQVRPLADIRSNFICHDSVRGLNTPKTYLS